MTPQAFRHLAIWLGAISLAAIVASLLALQDIFHAIEPDLSLEWWVVRFAFSLIIAFHLVSLVALRRSHEV